MAKAPATNTRGVVPQFGTIVGGELDGWAFALIRIETVGKEKALIVRCTPPDWPFADIVRLRKQDYQRLIAGKSDEETKREKNIERVYRDISRGQP